MARKLANHQFFLFIWHLHHKADYEAVHGAVTDAAPKVFLKYFFVNTVTGEKSGEMLGTIKLSAAAQAGE